MERSPRKRPRRVAGWPLVGWAALALALMVALVFALRGTGEEAWGAAARATARSSALLFLAAFTASSLQRLLRRPWTAWLLANRRFLGVSFAVSHTYHLAILLILNNRWGDGVDLRASAPGVVVYLFIALMAATSFNTTAAWLGRRRWKILHKVGAYSIWLAFTGNFFHSALVDPTYIPAALAFFAALALRITVSLRTRARAPVTRSA